MSDGGGRFRPNRVQASVVVLVAGSGSLSALTVGAGVAGVAAATLVGLLVGIALAAYLTAIVPEGGSSNRPGRRRR